MWRITLRQLISQNLIRLFRLFQVLRQVSFLLLYLRYGMLLKLNFAHQQLEL